MSDDTIYTLSAAQLNQVSGGCGELPGVGPWPPLPTPPESPWIPWPLPSPRLPFPTPIWPDLGKWKLAN